jgi:hypothetical protein
VCGQPSINQVCILHTYSIIEGVRAAVGKIGLHLTHLLYNRGCAGSRQNKIRSAILHTYSIIEGVQAAVDKSGLHTTHLLGVQVAVGKIGSATLHTYSIIEGVQAAVDKSGLHTTHLLGVQVAVGKIGSATLHTYSIVIEGVRAAVRTKSGLQYYTPTL